MKYLFIAGIIILSNGVYGMRDPYISDDPLSKKSVNETVIMSTTPILPNGQVLRIESEDDFSDTSSSTVDLEGLLPLSNRNINELIRQEISPDVCGVTTLKVDFANLGQKFAPGQDVKDWKPPLIPFEGGSEMTESQGETDKDGNWLDFAF